MAATAAAEILLTVWPHLGGRCRRRGRAGVAVVERRYGENGGARCGGGRRCRIAGADVLGGEHGRGGGDGAAEALVHDQHRVGGQTVNVTRFACFEEAHSGGKLSG